MEALRSCGEVAASFARAFSATSRPPLTRTPSWTTSFWTSSSRQQYTTARSHGDVWSVRYGHWVVNILHIYYKLTFDTCFFIIIYVVFILEKKYLSIYHLPLPLGNYYFWQVLGRKEKKNSRKKVFKQPGFLKSYE